MDYLQAGNPRRYAGVPNVCPGALDASHQVHGLPANSRKPLPKQRVSSTDISTWANPMHPPGPRQVPAWLRVRQHPAETHPAHHGESVTFLRRLHSIAGRPAWRRPAGPVRHSALCQRIIQA